MMKATPVQTDKTVETVASVETGTAPVAAYTGTGDSPEVVTPASLAEADQEWAAARARGQRRNLFQRINAVMGEVGSIPKTGTNKNQNYPFIEQSVMMAVLRPLFVKHGLVILPEIVSTTYHVPEGARQTTARCEMRFTIANADVPAESIVCAWMAEGADMADKGVNKAGTSGTKYWLMKLLMLSDREDPDADGGQDSSNGHQQTRTENRQQAGQQQRQAPPQQRTTPPPGQRQTTAEEDNALAPIEGQITAIHKMQAGLGYPLITDADLATMTRADAGALIVSLVKDIDAAKARSVAGATPPRAPVMPVLPEEQEQGDARPATTVQLDNLRKVAAELARFGVKVSMSPVDAAIGHDAADALFKTWRGRLKTLQEKAERPNRAPAFGG